MFEFRPGPIFRQMILADEINRATPRTQSALLEAMEERQVTVDGMTYPLPEPFYVIATQNPHHYSGTFSLPESQLDRFLMRIELGYPDPQAERTLLMSPARQSVLHDQPALFSVAELLQLQEAVAAVYVSAPLLDYVLAIIGYTRHSGEYPNGLSPRAGLALLQAARAWALLDGRDAVIPEDVQAVLPAVAGHRIGGGASHSGLIVAGVLKNVPLY